MARLKKHLEGSTLVETLVSMTLIVIIIGGSFSALTAIAKSTMNQVKIYADFVIKETLANDIYSIETDTLRNDYGGFIIEKELVPYYDAKGLHVLTIKAVTPGGKVICSRRRIVSITEKLDVFLNEKKLHSSVQTGREFKGIYAD